MAVDWGATDARSIRRFNERAVLLEMRRTGPVSKPEIARRVALTPQAVNTIVDGLVRSGFAREDGRRTGAIGFPSTLFTLRPDGAYAIGIKVGRRSVETLLVDFAGHTVHRVVNEYARPDVETVVSAIADTITQVTAFIGSQGIDSSRVVGVGVGMPAFMTELGRALGGVDDATTFWRDVDLRAHLERITDLPIFIESDGAASAVAELMAGGSAAPTAFVSIFIGAFVGAGLVLHGESQLGHTGRAAQLASVPVPAADGSGWVPLQERASLISLYRRLRDAGCEIRSAAEIQHAAETHRDVVEAWLQDAAAALVVAIAGVQALNDLEAVIIDADLPSALLDRLVAATAEGIERSPLPIAPPRIARSVLGRNAAALGAALLPLHEFFSPKLSVLTRGQSRPQRTNVA